jgi:universal stress protein E
MGTREPAYAEHITMYPIHRILVAVKDPQARQIPAIAKAGQLAHALDAKVCLFHAIPGPLYLDVARFNEQTVAELEKQDTGAHLQRLERLAQPLRRKGIEVTTAVEWDYPSQDAVIRAATHFEADLIIADCHRAMHAAPWLLHFTDWELLRKSSLPVLLVKNRRPYRRSKVLAAVDPFHENAKPENLDGEILRFGGTIADALQGSLHAVHAYNAALTLTSAELTVPPLVAKIQAEAASRAHRALDAKLQTLGVTSRRRHIVEGFPLDAIGGVAQKIKAEILVMGAISRSGLKRLFIGNTAEMMLDRVTCDVLIVKPRQFRNGISRVPRGPQLITAPLLPGGFRPPY